MTDARVSREHLEALVQPASSDRRVSAERTEALVQPSSSSRRLSAQRVEVLVGGPNEIRVSALAVEVLVPSVTAPPSGSFSWWDGTARQAATLRGWWDGAAIQPAAVHGWWDGAVTQSLA